MNNTTVIQTPKTARQIKAEYAAEKAQREVDAKRRMERTAARKAKWGKGVGIARNVITGAFVLAIAAFALWASFQHLRHLGILLGQDATHWYSPANMIPLTVDCLMFVASIRLRTKGITGTAVWIAQVSMLAGLLVSAAGNVYDGLLTAPEGITAAQLAWRLFWNAVPVLALLGATEMLTHTHKGRKIRANRSASEARVPGRSTSTAQLAVDGI
jgi:uncharacterized protein DUF2637